MARSSSTAFPLEYGKNKVSSGTFGAIRFIRCYEDGDLTITTMNDAIVVESFIAGEDVVLTQCKSLEVSGGLFSLSSATVA